MANDNPARTLQLYDVSAPATPRLLSTTASTLLHPTRRVSGNTVLTSEVSDPLNPILVGNAPGPYGTQLGVLAGGRILFTAGESNSSSSPPYLNSQLPLRVLDMSMPGLLAEIGCDSNISGVFSLVTSGNYAYAATSTSVYIYTVNGVVTATRPKDQSARASTLFQRVAPSLLRMPRPARPSLSIT